MDVEGLKFAAAEPVDRFGYVRKEFSELASWYAATAYVPADDPIFWDTY